MKEIKTKTVWEKLPWILVLVLAIILITASVTKKDKKKEKITTFVTTEVVAIEKQPSEKQETAPSVATVQMKPETPEVQVPKEEIKPLEKPKPRKDPFISGEILAKYEKLKAENTRLKKEAAKKDEQIGMLKAKRAEAPIKKITQTRNITAEDFIEQHEVLEPEIQKYEAEYEPEEEYYEEPEEYIRPVISLNVWPYYSPYGWMLNYYWCPWPYSFLGRIIIYFDWYSYWYYPSYHRWWRREYPRHYEALDGALTYIRKNQLESRHDSITAISRNGLKKQTLGNVTAKDLGKFTKAGKSSTGKISTTNKGLKRVSKTGQIKTYPSNFSKGQIQKIKNQRNLSRDSGGISRRDSKRNDSPWGNLDSLKRSSNVRNPGLSKSRSNSQSSGSTGKSIRRGSSSGRKVSISSRSSPRSSSVSRSSGKSRTIRKK